MQMCLNEQNELMLFFFFFVQKNTENKKKQRMPPQPTHLAREAANENVAALLDLTAFKRIGERCARCRDVFLCHFLFWLLLLLLSVS
jgi:hypothetical protein